MKTAVSIPDDVFREADDVAQRLGWSRSQLYARAIQDFIESQGDDPVTIALDALAAELSTSPSPNMGLALIENGDWEW